MRRTSLSVVNIIFNHEIHKTHEKGLKIDKNLHEFYALHGEKNWKLFIREIAAGDSASHIEGENKKITGTENL